jgi:hypothetical protein
VGGLAPLDCSRDSRGTIYYNDQDDVEVVFAFSDTAKYDPSSYATKINTLAATIAQESAHAYGLGHADNQNDVMYPYTTGTTTGFTNTDSPYADSSNCAKGAGTQNSYKLLLQILGAHQGGGTTTDTTVPTIGFSAPASNATVGRNFSIVMSASDNVGVDHVDVELAGPSSRSTTLTGAPWSWNASVTSDGTYTITATAYDAAGNFASAKRTVKVAAGTTGGVDLGGGGGAVDMAGMMSMPGDVGTPCMESSDCASGQCLDSGNGKYCTQDCSLDDPSSCPSGYVCTDLGTDGAHCLGAIRPKSSSGCSMAGRADRGATGFFLLGLLAAPLLGHRRRTRAK